MTKVAGEVLLERIARDLEEKRHWTAQGWSYSIGKDLTRAVVAPFVRTFILGRLHVRFKWFC